MKKCNKDCFNCIYSDCIYGDADVVEITPQEVHASAEVDREAESETGKAVDRRAVDDKASRYNEVRARRHQRLVRADRTCRARRREQMIQAEKLRRTREAERREALRRYRAGVATGAAV